MPTERNLIAIARNWHGSSFMNAALMKLREAGFQVRVVGDKLGITPAECLSEIQLQWLKSHKTDILNALRSEQAANQDSTTDRQCVECVHRPIQRKPRGWPDTLPGPKRCATDGPQLSIHAVRTVPNPGRRRKENKIHSLRNSHAQRAHKA